MNERSRDIRGMRRNQIFIAASLRRPELREGWNCDSAENTRRDISTGVERNLIWLGEKQRSRDPRSLCDAFTRPHG